MKIISELTKLCQDAVNTNSKKQQPDSTIMIL